MSGTIQYPAAIDSSGQVVFAGQGAPRGKYSCIECGGPMVLRLGTQRRPHFAHLSKEACSGESALHKLAKRVIANAFRQALAAGIPYYASYRCGICAEHHRIDLTRLGIDIVEELAVAGIRPDLSILDRVGVQQAFIEVVFTHAPEEATRDTYKRLGKPICIVALDKQAPWSLLDLRDGLDLEDVLNAPSLCPKGHGSKGLRRSAVRNATLSTQCPTCHRTFRLVLNEVLIYEVSCWKCGQPTRVARFEREGEMYGPSIPPASRHLAEIMRQWGVIVKVSYSHTLDETYLMNRCNKCGAKIGYHFLPAAGEIHHYELGYCSMCNRWHVCGGHGHDRDVATSKRNLSPNSPFHPAWVNDLRCRLCGLVLELKPISIYNVRCGACGHVTAAASMHSWLQPVHGARGLQRVMSHFGVTIQNEHLLVTLDRKTMIVQVIQRNTGAVLTEIPFHHNPMENWLGGRERARRLWFAPLSMIITCNHCRHCDTPLVDWDLGEQPSESGQLRMLARCRRCKSWSFVD